MMMLKKMMIKLSQNNMKKTFAILSLVSGLFFGGCSEFELVQLRSPALKAALEAYAVESPEHANYVFNDVFLKPVFIQSLKGYFGSYDLNLVIYAKAIGKEVDVVHASIPQLNIETALKVNIKTDHIKTSSGLFFNYDLLIGEISGTDLYQAGSEGRTLDVIITAHIGDEIKTFDYSFSATKTKVAVPIR